MTEPGLSCPSEKASDRLVVRVDDERVPVHSVDIPGRPARYGFDRGLAASEAAVQQYRSTQLRLGQHQ